MRRSRNIAAERLAHWTISFDRIPHHTTVPHGGQICTNRDPHRPKSEAAKRVLPTLVAALKNARWDVREAAEKALRKIRAK
jgi:hypothetical protein